MRPYDAGYRALKKVITDGDIGEPLMLHCAHRNQSVGENYTTDMAITNTLIHELDVLRWLTEDDYKSVQVVFPRTTSKSHAKLKDPQIVLFETQKGIRIDVEIFVNCAYGYDIQCEVVGEEGIARLPEPSAIQMRKDARLGNALLTDWKDRFIDAYDVELQAFINDVKAGQLSGPSARDGFAASVAADACLKAQTSGAIEPLPCRRVRRFTRNNQARALNLSTAADYRCLSVRELKMNQENVKLAIAPIGWTNDDMPELGSENTFQQTVSEMALAGFTGSEVGSKYPRDPAVLKPMLDIRGMQICNAGLVPFCQR